ncbi:MAG: amino acid ABC transporter permease [Leptothrix sp. (in: b-proteobacteria)]
MIDGFAIVWSERSLLLAGLLNTVLIAVLAGLGALVLGALGSTALMPRSGRARVVARLAQGVVDALRCTPFLLFAYLIYYGLPSLGLRLDNWGAGLAALTIYHTAYLAEILRGAWVAQPREPIEAGLAFGYSGLRLFRRIVLPPLVLSSAPLVGNQLIQIIKDSAFLTIIALPELTHAASSIQSRHYIPFAAFISAVLLYWALCLVIESAVAAVGRLADARR